MGEDRTTCAEKKTSETFAFPCRQRHPSVISSCSEDAESDVTSAGYSQMPDEERDEELEYGPGIVNKLRTKFLSISLKHHRGNMTRSCSMENLLDQERPGQDSPVEKVVVGITPNEKQPWGNLKRAKSMDTLLMGLSPEPLPVKDEETKGPKIVKRRDGGPTICDEELPKPDTVKTYKRMFEPAESRRGTHSRRPPVLRATAKSCAASKINGIPPNPSAKMNGVTSTRKYSAKSSSTIAKSQSPVDAVVPAVNGNVKKPVEAVVSVVNGNVKKPVEAVVPVVNGIVKKPVEAVVPVVNGNVKKPVEAAVPVVNGNVKKEYSRPLYNGCHVVKATPVKIGVVTNNIRNKRDVEKNLNSINRLMNKKDANVSQKGEIISNGVANQKEILKIKPTDELVRQFNRAPSLPNLETVNTKPKVPPNRPSLKSPKPYLKIDELKPGDKITPPKLKPRLSNSHLADFQNKTNVTDSVPSNVICFKSQTSSEINVRDDAQLSFENRLNEEGPQNKLNNDIKGNLENQRFDDSLSEVKEENDKSNLSFLNNLKDPIIDTTPEAFVSSSPTIQNTKIPDKNAIISDVPNLNLPEMSDTIDGNINGCLISEESLNGSVSLESGTELKIVENGLTPVPESPKKSTDPEKINGLVIPDKFKGSLIPEKFNRPIKRSNGFVVPGKFSGSVTPESPNGSKIIDKTNESHLPVELNGCVTPEKPIGLTNPIQPQSKSSAPIVPVKSNRPITPDKSNRPTIPVKLNRPVTPPKSSESTPEKLTASVKAIKHATPPKSSESTTDGSVLGKLISPVTTIKSSESTPEKASGLAKFIRNATPPKSSGSSTDSPVGNGLKKLNPPTPPKSIESTPEKTNAPGKFVKPATPETNGESTPERCIGQKSPTVDKSSELQEVPGKDVVYSPSMPDSNPKRDRPVKKAQTSPTSMVFDFRGKDVVPHVAVLPVPFGCKPAHVKDTPSTNGVPLDEDDEDFVDYSVPSPCGVVFEGENVKVGRGSILATRNKDLKITFDDDVDNNTFVYPSETSLLEDSESTGGHQEAAIPNGLSSKLKTNTSIGSSSSGGLSSYTPSVLRTVDNFEPGMFRPAPAPTSDEKHRPEEEENTQDTTEPEMLKPADPDLISSWSLSAGASDLLF